MKWIWRGCRISTRESHGVVILDVRGSLTRESSIQTLGRQVSDLLATGERNFLLNLKKVRRINDHGLSALLGAYNAAMRRSGELKLVHLRKKVLKTLDEALLTPLFDVYDDEDQALVYFPVHEKTKKTKPAQASARANILARPTPPPAQRKGNRVPLSLLVRASWKTSVGSTATEDTLTEVLNGAGARIRLKAPVDKGLELLIANLHNRQAARARVVWVGERANHAGQPVGIKFLTPRGATWCTEFAG